MNEHDASVLAARIAALGIYTLYLPEHEHYAGSHFIRFWPRNTADEQRVAAMARAAGAVVEQDRPSSFRVLLDT